MCMWRGVKLDLLGTHLLAESLHLYAMHAEDWVDEGVRIGSQKIEVVREKSPHKLALLFGHCFDEILCVATVVKPLARLGICHELNEVEVAAHGHHVILLLDSIVGAYLTVDFWAVILENKLVRKLMRRSVI